MKSSMLVALCLLLSACSLVELPQQGASVTVSPIKHEFVIRVNDSHWKQAVEEVKRIASLVDLTDERLELSLAIGETVPVRIEKALQRVLLKHGLAPTRYHVSIFVAEPKSIAMTLTLHRLDLDTCQPYRYGHPQTNIGCYTESMRMNQVAHPQHLMPSVKG
ncbi:hypothetical protein [Veronia pacifica]|uniref:Lipoprotein n=1 Tax=Veronia pacifica TaxID=1080227 RepID=A0A1C3ES82_9GAMM|nr:hypothetical protein [Veronia pacifica]ODA36081.1 hypothetical protein A8L45_00300 [Veronia pacifica]